MTPDPYLKRLLWFLLVGTRGGENRARIINLLREKMLNANQISESLKLDYKTVQHHLKVLKQHNLLAGDGEGYGATFGPTPYMLSQLELFDEFWRKMVRGESIERPRRVHV